MYKNLFLINQVGYRCQDSKKLIYLGSAESFTVSRLQDLKLISVLSGRLEDSPGCELARAKYGDFSAVTAPGIYRINTDEGNSRCFIVSDNAYDTTARLAVEFFTWQRCNSDLGWNGNCHANDSIKLQSGEVRGLGKGHHQSSDLRKWAWGTSLGIIGLAEYALRCQPLWDKGRIADELRHNADYFMSLILDSGAVMDCTWVPQGYDAEKAGKGYGDYAFSWHSPRIYFESPAPEPAQWNVLRTLALISRYFINSDPDYSHKCLDCAKRIWAYMQGAGVQLQDYDLPLYPPLGHEGMTRFYKGFYPDSALRHASRAICAQALYTAVSDNAYRATAKESLEKLAHMRVGGDIMQNPAAACFYEGNRSARLANNYIYFYCTTVPQAFAGALEIWADDEQAGLWRESANAIADQCVAISRNNPFGRLPGTWYTQGNDVFETPGCFSFSTNEAPAYVRAKSGFAEPKGKRMHVEYDYNSFCFNLDLLANAVFLVKMDQLEGNARFREVAQRQLDWILGINPYDASNIEGVGYNHPHRGIFGEFFPPVPQIPGGVFTGITDTSFSMEAQGYDCEYDMPMVGWLLYLLSVLKA